MKENNGYQYWCNKGPITQYSILEWSICIEVHGWDPLVGWEAGQSNQSHYCVANISWIWVMVLPFIMGSTGLRLYKASSSVRYCLFTPTPQISCGASIPLPNYSSRLHFIRTPEYHNTAMKDNIQDQGRGGRPIQCGYDCIRSQLPYWSDKHSSYVNTIQLL